MTSKALNLCYQIHQGHYDTQGMPYVFHPFAVANEMSTEDEVCTALLQEVLDEADVTDEDLKEMGFDEEIRLALHLLHKPRTMDYFSYIRRLKANPLARKVKLADIQCSLQSCVFAKECMSVYKTMQQQNAALEILS